jgi:recombinational DNA repair ATPase RecF
MKQEQETLSVVERIRRARLAVAHEKAEKRKAAKQAQKITAIQLATQRKAQRTAIKNQEKFPKQKSFIGLVPYVAPTQATKNLVLYKPSLSRVRLKRRQQKQVSALNIPIGGQAM